MFIYNYDICVPTDHFQLFLPFKILIYEFKQKPDFGEMRLQVWQCMYTAQQFTKYVLTLVHFRSNVRGDRNNEQMYRRDYATAWNVLLLQTKQSCHILLNIRSNMSYVPMLISIFIFKCIPQFFFSHVTDILRQKNVLYIQSNFSFKMLSVYRYKLQHFIQLSVLLKCNKNIK